MTLPIPPKPPVPPKYLSFIRSRRDNFKTHNNIGHAKTALGNFINSNEGGTVGENLFVWELKDSEYELMWNIPAGTLNTDLPWPMKIHKPYRPPHVQCRCPACTK